MHVTLRTPNFATSAQVQTSQFSDLAKGGFMVIVNDRPDRESDDQPLSSKLAGEAKRQGLGYAYIPIVPLVIAGLLVGFGTRLGNGCTSGHGVCGVARFSPRSLAATATFMCAGFMLVAIMRYMVEG